MDSNCLSRSLLLFAVFSLLLYFGCQATSSPENGSDAKTKSEQGTSSSKPGFEAKGKNYPIPPWPITSKKGRGKIFPFDEASKDKTFADFRQKLYNALNEKDVDYLLSVVSDSVHFSYVEGGSDSGFIEYFQLKAKPNSSRLWRQMSMCLELGGKFDQYNGKKFFIAPYVHTVEDFDDPFTEGVIIGDNVRLREKPGSDARIIGSLNWDHCILQRQSDYQEETINGETHSWFLVKTINGEKGYVYGKYFRSPIDYRVGFTEVEKGKWMIDFFVAGD